MESGRPERSSRPWRARSQKGAAGYAVTGAAGAAATAGDHQDAALA